MAILEQAAVSPTAKARKKKAPAPYLNKPAVVAPVKPFVPTKRWTYTDYLTLPDDKRYEIINGELMTMAAPSTDHQRCLGKLHRVMDKYLANQPVGESFLAPTDVILSDENTVQPDIVFIAEANRSIIAPHGIVGAPDLIVEIISPSSIQRDHRTKMALYEKFGVKEYWIIDPAWQVVEIYALTDGVYTLFASAIGAGKPAVPSKLLDGFSVKVEDVLTV